MIVISRACTRFYGTILLLLFVSGCAGGGGSTGGNLGAGRPIPLAFAPRTDLSTGANGSEHVLIADFNKDGRLDIAVSGFNPAAVSVFLNKGDGTFTGPILTSISASSIGFAATVVGDFNEDGYPDLIVGGVLLGNGDGTFRQGPPPASPWASLASDAKVADLNGDGHLDLVQVGWVAGQAGSGFMAVSLGNGDGTFRPTSEFNAASSPGSYIGLAVADFNGDKKMDILAFDWGVTYNLASWSSIPSTLVFYAGNGDGTFQAPLLTTTWNFVAGGVNADFAGNGQQDLLIVSIPASIGTPISDGKDGIVFGNGDGTFQGLGVTPIPLAESGDFVQAADMDLDGKADVLTANRTTGVLTVVQSSSVGQGPTAPGVYQFAIAPGLNSIATGDLNGDGLPDIVVSNSTTQQISILLSQKQ